MTVPIPEYIDQVDARWVSDALSLRRPGTVVRDLELIGDRPGAGNKLFFRPTYQDAEGRPETFVVKGGFVAREPDEFTVGWEAMTRRLNAAEARFYRDHAGGPGVETPACHFAGLDPDSGRGAVILEDLTASGVRFGAYDTPLTPDTAADVLGQLARLHARWWGHPVLDGPDLLDPLVEENGLLHWFITEENWNAQLSRPRGARVPAELQDRGRVVDAVHAMWAAQFDPPLTALHGDPHIGNLYFRADGRTGLLDWQVFSRGTWSVDVAYFVAGALDTPTRRVHERALLGHYLEVLAGHGVDPPDPDTAWTAYRQRLFHGFLNFLTPADGIQSEEYNATMGERFATAILDLGSFDTVRSR